MLFELECSKSIEELDRSLRQAATDHHFGILAVHDLEQTLKEKGHPLGNACRVYELCNPQQAKQVLDHNPAFSSLLPCRVSVYGSGAKLVLSTVLPVSLFSLISGGNQKLLPVASEVEDDMKAMMREAVH